jgi:hypothetical protein
MGSRAHDENLRAWFARHSELELRNYLAGTPVASVERDALVAALPHGVE